jgi:hypothetical protein
MSLRGMPTAGTRLYWAVWNAGGRRLQRYWDVLGIVLVMRAGGTVPLWWQQGGKAGGRN